MQTICKYLPAASNASESNAQWVAQTIPSTPFDFVKISPRLGSGSPLHMMTSQLKEIHIFLVNFKMLFICYLIFNKVIAEFDNSEWVTNILGRCILKTGYYFNSNYVWCSAIDTVQKMW